MFGKVQPDQLSSGPTNNYQDVGIDASYQYLGTRRHVFTVSGSYINEQQTRTASFDAGGAADRTGTLQNLSISGSYTYDQTYGVTLGVQNTWGGKDLLLYPEVPQFGSRNGSPDSTAWILEADWTPFGKESSWAAPWANLRLGLQYTMYTRFNGSGSDYDGFGRDASDNNTFFTYVWFAL